MVRESIIAAWIDARRESEADATCIASRVEVTVTTSQNSERSVSDYAEWLETSVAEQALAQARGELIVMRGIAMANDEGRAVVVIAEPETADAALLALGETMSLVATDFVGITDTLDVLSYVPPHIPGDGSAPIAQSDRGLSITDDPSPRLAAVVLVQHTPGAHPVTAQPLSLVGALQPVVSQTLLLGSLTEPLHRLAALAGATGGIRTITVGEISDLPAALASLLSFSPAAPDDWRGYGPVSHEGEVRWADITDAIETDDGPIVMVDSIVRVIGGIGPAIWRRARTGATIDELVDAALDEFGTPPGDPRDLVVTAVEVLEEQGLVIWDRPASA